MILSLVKVPNLILSKSAKKITRFDARLKQLIADMQETLVASKDPEGVGLAAPQVGVCKQLFVTRAHKKAKLRSYINPVIIKTEEVVQTKTKEEDTAIFEGCLSIDRIWAPITRPGKVLLKYQNEKGRTEQKWFQGFEATIIQHEVDHLNGVLFTQRAVEQDAEIYEEQHGKLKEIAVL